MWFRADFEFTSVANKNFQSLIGKPMLDSEYFECDTDDGALEHAKWLAEQGTYFADAGRCGLDLTYLAEVDNDSETFEEKRVIYY